MSKERCGCRLNPGGLIGPYIDNSNCKFDAVRGELQAMRPPYGSAEACQVRIADGNCGESNHEGGYIRPADCQSGRVRGELREVQKQFSDRVDASNAHDKALKERAEQAESEVAALRQELRSQTTFNAAFADKLKEFGTIDRLVEEYSLYKQENRDLTTRVGELERALNTIKLLGACGSYNGSNELGFIAAVALAPKEPK